MRIGLDIDGVMFDFAASLERYLVRIGKHRELNISQPTRWEFYLDWGIEEWEFIDLCNDGVDEGYVFSGGVMDMAPSAVNFMRNMGNTIHIVTDRFFGRYPEQSHKATEYWLNQHEIEYDSLTFSGDKTVIRTDVFIEDKLSNYDALVKNGTDCYLVDRPWNQDLGDNRKRVKSIQEFASIVGGM